MEEADDFGDLYADLDDDVVAGTSATGALTSELNDTPIAPIVGEAEGKVEPAAADAYGVAEGSESSDSDDDLRIVLNDEDCRKFPLPAQRVVLNGGMVSGWNDEEDGEDEIVAGADGASRDPKWVEQPRKPGDGLGQGGAERGSGPSGGYRNWPVGSHSIGFSSNARSSISGRGGRENLVIPCTGGGAFSNSGLPTAAAFSLPRYRTIFEINIEEFEHKPWKNHGADMTDYFNFGLDEESWKSYCKHMNHFRQQSTFLRTHLYDSTKPSQLLEFEMVSTKALPSDVAHGEHGGKFSSDENVDKGGTGFELPRGRAIQVEGGVVERIPSMDTRRPRPRDSDVVIQITMEDSVKGASVQCKEELIRVEQVDIDGSVLNSDNNLLKSLSPVHDEQRFGEIISCVEHYYPEKQTFFKETTMEVKSKNNDAENPSRAEVFMLSDESASCDHVLHNSASSDLGSHSKASKDGLSLEKFLSIGKKTSSSPDSRIHESIQSDSYPSNDSRSGAIKIDQAYNGDCMPECSVPVRDQKYYRRKRIQSGTTSSLTDCEMAFMHKNRQNVSYPRDVSYRKRKRDCDSDTRRPLSYEEIEISRSNNSRRDAERIAGDKFYASTFHKDSHETSLWRNQHERDCVLEQSVTTGDNGRKKRDFYYQERYHYNRQTRGSSPEDPIQSISEYKSLRGEKGSCLRQKETEDRWIRMESDYDSMVFEERYEEHQREVCGRHMSYCDSEDEIFNHEFERHVSQTSRKVRSIERRYKHELDPPFGFCSSSRYIENDVKNWRYNNHRPADSKKYREHPAANGGWPDAISATKQLPSLLRSAERYADYGRLSDGREVHSNGNEVRCSLVQGSKDHHRSREIYSDFDNDGQLAEETDLYVDTIVSSKKRASNSLAKPTLCTDEIKVKHQGRKGPSFTEGLSFHDRSSRHDRTRVSQYSNSGLKFSDDHLLTNFRKKTVTEGCSNSDNKDHSSFISEIFDSRRKELESIGRNKAVNIHVNGWKGKFSKRSSDVTHESNGQSDINPRNKKLESTGHMKEVNLRKEVSPLTSKVERPNSLQMERLKNMSEYSKNHIIQNYHVKNSTQPDQDDDEIEEGQLIEEPDVQDVVSVVKEDNSHKKVAHPATAASHLNRVEKNRLPKDLTGDNRVGEFNSDRILETLAKMEKRRERFKEPIPAKPMPEKIQSSKLEAAVATEEAQQQRPARKRRWAGS